MAKETPQRVEQHRNPARLDGPAAPNPAQPSALVEALFPGGVAAAELRAPGDPAQLDPEEALSVARAVPKRVGEFAAGRLCARSALARFGIASFAVRARPRSPAALARGARRQHHAYEGFCAAVVGEQARFVGLGLDSENADAVSPDLWPSICIAAELAWIDSLPASSALGRRPLVFAAKEAFYKCQYPSTGEWLSFSDLRIVPRERALLEGSFDVEAQRTLQALAPQRAGASYPLRTAYRFHEEFVSVGVALHARERLRGSRLIGLVVAEQLDDRQKNDLDVEHRRPVPQVIEIVIDARLHLLELRGLAAAAVHLRKPGDAGQHLVADHVALNEFAVLLVVRDRVRSGPTRLMRP